MLNIRRLSWNLTYNSIAFPSKAMFLRDESVYPLLPSNFLHYQLAYKPTLKIFKTQK